MSGLKRSRSVEVKKTAKAKNGKKALVAGLLGKVADAFRAIQEDKKNVNELLSLIEIYNLNEDPDVLSVAAEAILKTFRIFAEDGVLITRSRKGTGAEADSSLKLSTWMASIADSYRKRSYELLHTEGLESIGFNALMQLIHLSCVEQAEEYAFPVDQVVALIEFMVLNLDSKSDAYSLLDEAINSYRDIRFYVLRGICRLAAGFREAPESQETLEPTYRRLFAILSEVAMETDAELEAGTAEAAPFFVQAKLPSAVSSTGGHLQEFSSCWLEVLQGMASHAPSLHRPFLHIVNDRVMPYMVKPTLLADYLTESYNTGGMVSLLALNGLFTLMHRYNLDYPAFFPKLYSLLDANILHCRYRKRFCRLFALFMTSTHMPAYLVAAFVKRLARLGLNAPVAVIPWLMGVIYNLFKAHPAIRDLIHRDEAVDRNSDPYDMAEPDPSKCRALESSLWEIEAFGRHYWTTAIKTSRMFSERLTKPPFNLDALLEGKTYNSLIQEELSHKWTKVPPVNISLTTALF